MAEGQDQDKAQKTEEPTPKKLEEAFKKGEVAKSQEVGHWFMTFGMTLVVLMFAAGLGQHMSRSFIIFFREPHLIATDPGNLIQLLKAALTNIVTAMMANPQFPKMPCSLVSNQNKGWAIHHNQP